jgi:hypothetical protein
VKLDKAKKELVKSLLAESAQAVEDARKADREAKTGSKTRFERVRLQGVETGITTALIAIFGEDAVALVEDEITTEKEKAELAAQEPVEDAA